MYLRHRRLGPHHRSSHPGWLALELWGSMIIALLMLDGLASAQSPPKAKETPLYIQRGVLQLQLRGAIRVFGDCLEQPGKERLTLSGALERPNDPQPVPVRLVWELPSRVRLEEQAPTSLRVTTYDGSEIQKAEGGKAVSSIDNNDETIIETLAYDTPMHFFLGQFEGLATRFLDSRVRLDESQSRDYKGPFYDVYEVHDRVNIRRGVRHQLKRYYFNSDTLLLERVRYTLERNQSQIPVEVLLSQWRGPGAATTWTNRTLGEWPAEADPHAYQWYCWRSRRGRNF